VAAIALAKAIFDCDGVSAPAESTGRRMTAASADAAILDWLPHDPGKPMRVMLPLKEALH
jgi:hypothetical protein